MFNDALAKYFAMRPLLYSNFWCEYVQSKDIQYTVDSIQTVIIVYICTMNKKVA